MDTVMEQHPLTRYRLQKGVSVETLAKAARVSRQTIYRIERGELSPSLDLVARLIEATGRRVRADDFLPRA